jgi:type IV secretory pathway VirB10-like protein
MVAFSKLTPETKIKLFDAVTTRVASEFEGNLAGVTLANVKDCATILLKKAEYCGSAFAWNGGVATTFNNEYIAHIGAKEGDNEKAIHKALTKKKCASGPSSDSPRCARARSPPCPLTAAPVPAADEEDDAPVPAANTQQIDELVEEAADLREEADAKLDEAQKLEAKAAALKKDAKEKHKSGTAKMSQAAALMVGKKQAAKKKGGKPADKPADEDETDGESAPASKKAKTLAGFLEEHKDKGIFAILRTLKGIKADGSVVKAVVLSAEQEAALGPVIIGELMTFGAVKEESEGAAAD